jgi:chitinase
VVSHDRRIDLANLQLTVDNTAPEVKITSPQSGEQYHFQQGMTIMMNAAVNDNLALQQVEFYLDGELQTTLVESPYVILWDGVPGKHTLVVRAIDLAGNQSKTSISFNVSR